MSASHLPFKAFTHRPTLGTEVCFCMKGIPSLGEPKATFFLHCTRSHSSISFFVWLSPKSIQISEKENGEVTGWQRGLFLGHGKGRRGWGCSERKGLVLPPCLWVPEVT